MKKEIEILKVKGNTKEIQKDFVVEEFSAQISFNGKTVYKVSCTPKDLKYLGVGSLYSNGILASVEGLKIKVDKTRVNVVGKKREKEFFKSKVNEYTISLDSIFKRISELLTSSTLFNKTGGCHMVGIFDLQKEKFIYIAEDIARHSAVEKCVGYLLLNSKEVRKPVLFASGRANSKIIEECANVNIPIVVTKSAVTDKAVQRAQELGLTLVGFVRGNRANVYSHPERVEM